MAEAPTPLAKLDPTEAWKPWKPNAQDRWNLRWAGHLYRRAAFGGAWGELQTAVKEGPEKTIDLLLTGKLSAKGKPEAVAFNQLMDELAPAVARDQQFNFDTDELQAWWLYRMVYTPHPLEERLTLFWHNHFATSVAKVRLRALMKKQNVLIRKHALGKFRPFVLEMSKDPAMLLWLDSNSNIKGKPNENYARELMELFSLGVGNYTEADIREAARAFTGWHTAGAEYIFNKVQHDDGEKTVLGQKGNWDGNDIVRIVLEQKAAPYFLVRKLYKHFVSENETPPDTLLAPLAERFRKSDYDIADLIGAMLRSRHFFSEYAYRQRIKSPVEYMVGLLHSLEGQVRPTDLVHVMDGMGQTLFAPPNVKGWDGGRAWLNSATVLARHNLAWDFIGGEDGRFMRPLNPLTLHQKHAKSEPGLRFYLDLFLQGDVNDGARKKLEDFLKQDNPKDEVLSKRTRELVHTILLMPEYNLA